MGKYLKSNGYKLMLYCLIVCVCALTLSSGPMVTLGKTIQTQATVGFKEPTNIVISPGHNKGAVYISFTYMNQTPLTLQVTQWQGEVPVSQKLINTSSVVTETNYLGKALSYVRYQALLTNLLPGTRYTYQFVKGGQVGVAHQLITHATEEPTQLLFFGDLQGYTKGQYDQFATYLDKGIQLKPKQDAVFFAGDIVDDGSNFDQWQYFYDSIKKYSDSMLMTSTPGNHDLSHKYPYYAQTFVKASLWNNWDSAMNNSFGLGNVRIFIWDTEKSSSFDSQGKWLIENAKKCSEPFKIVLMHRSAYPMQYDEKYIRNLTTYFEQAGIDVVLSGHDHVYNRTSMFKNQVSSIADGISYICLGSGSGSKYYDFKEIEGGRFWKQIIFDQNTPIFSQLEITTNQLTWNAYTISDKQLKQIDSFTIKK